MAQHSSPIFHFLTGLLSLEDGTLLSGTDTLEDSSENKNYINN